jgi:TolB-like protein
MKKGLLSCIFCIVVHAFAGEPIETKIQLLCDSLSRQFPDSIVAPRLAVLPFTDNTGRNQGQAVAELMIIALQKQGRFKLVDRTEFQKAIMEIEISQSDMIDSTTALRIGKVLTAPYLCTGTIADIFGTSRINVKILRTETTEIMAAAWVAAAPAALDGLTKKLFGERMQVTASLFRSAAAPGWGQFYSRQPLRGALCLAAFIGAGGYSIYSAQQTAEAKREWRNNSNREDSLWMSDISADTARFHISWPSAVKRDKEKLAALYNDYSDKFDRTVIAGAITGAVWAINLLDAAIAGAQARRAFRPYFSASAGGRYGTGIAVSF